MRLCPISKDNYRDSLKLVSRYVATSTSLPPTRLLSSRLSPSEAYSACLVSSHIPNGQRSSFHPLSLWHDRMRLLAHQISPFSLALPHPTICHDLPLVLATRCIESLAILRFQVPAPRARPIGDAATTRLRLVLLAKELNVAKHRGAPRQRL